MAEQFSVFSAVAYVPGPEPFPLLQRHYKRLRTAYAALATELPASWCATVPFPTEPRILAELQRCVQTGGVDSPQRIRLLVNEHGAPEATSGPLDVMPAYPVRVVLDAQATDYSTPFLRYKTTRRDVYDAARARMGANLTPSPDANAPPFDVLLHNERLEMTETSIANCAFCLDPRVSPVFLTPPTACGLLEGVQRAELLENGRIVEGTVTLTEVKEAAAAGTLRVLCFNAVRGVFDAYVAK